MRDVTPKNNMQMLTQSLIYALIIVIIIAFLKVALDAFYQWLYISYRLHW